MAKSNKQSKKLGKGCTAVILLRATTLNQSRIAEIVGLSPSRVSTLKYVAHAQGVKLPKHRTNKMAA